MTPEKIAIIREQLKKVSDDGVSQLFALAMAEIKRRGAQITPPVAPPLGGKVNYGNKRRIVAR